MEGQLLSLRQAYISDMSILLGLEPFQKLAVVVVVGGGGWWLKGILEFRFGPNLWTWDLKLGPS